MRNYDETRNHFGSLFDFQKVPMSSFMSLYLSCGVITVADLYYQISNKTYRQELMWNQFCILWCRHYHDVVYAEYGAYDRKRRWASEDAQKKLLAQIAACKTNEPLINAIMR